MAQGRQANQNFNGTLLGSRVAMTARAHRHGKPKLDVSIVAGPRPCARCSKNHVPGEAFRDSDEAELLRDARIVTGQDARGGPDSGLGRR